MSQQLTSVPPDELVVPAYRLQAIIDAWEASHCEWCCTNGCAHPGGRHVATDVIHKWIATLDRTDPEAYQELPTTPCPGTCSCEVGLYVTALRAAMNPELLP